MCVVNRKDTQIRVLTGRRRSASKEGWLPVGAPDEPELQEPHPSRFFGHLECLLDHADQDAAVVRPHRHIAMEPTLCAVLTDQPARPRTREQNRAADVSCLPLHPVVAGGIDDGVALADRLVRRIIFREELARSQLLVPQMPMQVDVPELMSERGPKPVLASPVIGQVLRNRDLRSVIRMKLGHALHVSTVVGEISIHVQRIGMLLDQDRQIIRRNGELDGSVPRLEEGEEDALTFLIELRGFVMGAQGETSGRISNHPHHFTIRFRPC
jgi:hypothetical protein